MHRRQLDPGQNDISKMSRVLRGTLLPTGQTVLRKIETASRVRDSVSSTGCVNNSPPKRYTISCVRGNVVRRLVVGPILERDSSGPRGTSRERWNRVARENAMERFSYQCCSRLVYSLDLFVRLRREVETRISGKNVSSARWKE